MNKNTGQKIGETLKGHFETLYLRTKKLEKQVNNLTVAIVGLGGVLALSILSRFIP